MPEILRVAGSSYEVVDTKEKLTVADSFVLPSNKLGKGNGEAKFYVGNEGPEVRGFFGAVGFRMNCFMLRDDLLKYLADTEPEYRHPEQPYRAIEELPGLWKERLDKVKHLPEVIRFQADEQVQIGGPRVYINARNNPYYSLIRELSLPNITYISTVKLRDEDGKTWYYLRLFVDYFGNFGSLEHPSDTKQAEKEIVKSKVEPTTRDQLSKARVGQGKFKEDLLHECPFCPITMVSDDRLLIASHIKPWRDSNDRERLDPKNGLLLTPTYDKLFDLKLISFDDDKRMLVSPFLSRMTCSKLSLVNNHVYQHLPLDGRREYMAYHREKFGLARG